MKTLLTIREMQAESLRMRRENRTVSLVPTMGALHEGHLSLIEEARRRSAQVVVSVFVNPVQFGPGEDFASYPRNMERDAGLCMSKGVDVLFAPLTEEMYEPGHSVYVQEERLSNVMCGRSRPGHFRGVATVVCKLFNIVQPHIAIFGLKDYQQVRVIQRMAQDLNMPVSIVAMPTVREADGLAMSSRNAYLSDEERRRALCLVKSLDKARTMYSKGCRASAEIRTEMESIIRGAAGDIDYIEIADADSLAPVTVMSGPTVIALAVRIGRTRLIDNTVLPGPQTGETVG